MFTTGIALIACGFLFAVGAFWIETRPGAGNDVKMWEMRERSWLYQTIAVLGWRALLISAGVVLSGVAMIAA